MNLSALQPLIKTKTERTEIMVFFQNLSNEIYKNNFDLKEHLSKTVSGEFADAVITLTSDNLINTDNKSGLEKFFLKVQAEIKNLPTAHIILAFNPKKELIQLIQEWFYEKFKKIVILDIAVDPDIIGGCVISFNGRANDYTLLGKIERLSE
jgi:hypothetical protein